MTQCKLEYLLKTQGWDSPIQQPSEYQTPEYRTLWVSGIQMLKAHDLAELSNTGRFGPLTGFFGPAFRPSFNYQAIWQPDANLPFEYQKSLVFRWLLYSEFSLLAWIFIEKVPGSSLSRLKLCSSWGGYNRTSRPALRRLLRDCRCRRGCRGRQGRPLLHRLIYTGSLPLKLKLNCARGWNRKSSNKWISHQF